jgi:hypothetical protein
LPDCPQTVSICLRLFYNANDHAVERVKYLMAKASGRHEELVDELN